MRRRVTLRPLRAAAHVCVLAAADAPAERPRLVDLAWHAALLVPVVATARAVDGDAPARRSILALALDHGRAVPDHDGYLDAALDQPQLVEALLGQIRAHAHDAPRRA